MSLIVALCNRPRSMSCQARGQALRVRSDHARPRVGPWFIRRLGKTTTFLTDAFLENIPPIPPDSLSVIACWHLLDLLPRDAIPALLTRLWSYLRTGGVLFCLLREPSLPNGAGTRWWLDSLMTLRSDPESKLPFLYPVVTNREIETWSLAVISRPSSPDRRAGKLSQSSEALASA